MDLTDFLTNMAITTILTTIKGSVKNAKKKEQLKTAMLKVRNAINTLYLGDPDFAEK